MNDRQNGESLARIAGAIADPSRATMLLGLLDGRAWTATELADHAGIARSTATAHLHTLVECGLLEERYSGRHRYLRLADARSASLIETLSLATLPAPPTKSLKGARSDAALRSARTCYDHLAGSLGVALLDRLLGLDYLALDPDPVLTVAGEKWCTGLGVDLDTVRSRRRPFARLCLDWTERREHLAGSLATALLQQFHHLGWVSHGAKRREVVLTDAGRHGFREHLGIDWALVRMS
ncbi:ArsR/SmtB family transcription factor [Glutamicibacter sp. X7]